MPKVLGVDHLTISVSDFERSRAFYDPLLKFLGFEVLGEYGHTMGWTNGKTRLWIAQADDKGRRYKYRFHDVGFHHYAWELGSREEVDELQAWLEKAGAVIVDPACEYYEDYYAVFFLDPDGMKLEGMKYAKADLRLSGWGWAEPKRRPWTAPATPETLPAGRDPLQTLSEPE
jgi:catechol 2,3-dioxygenase-like lactoylglutathione lyase family enzyme